MKAALFEKPHELNIVSRPLRALLKDEVLVKVDSCGVCGTDVHILEGTSRSTPPVVLGHEYWGVVEDAGPETGDIREGQKVAIDPNISCGTCYYCRRGLVHLCANLKALGVDIDGGMAERCIVPAGQLHVLPDTIKPEAGAFVEPISCALHGIDRAGIRAGDSVVILGGGTIGLIMLQLVRSAGAARAIVVEPLVHKQQVARTLGADHVIDPSHTDAKTAILDLTHVGADVVIECVGSPRTMQLAIEVARRGGVVEFFGVCPVGETIPIEPNQVYFKELTITGSYVNPHTFARAIAMLESGKITVDKFKIDRFPLEGAREAIELQRRGGTLKSIIQPNA
jgi:2-desacetyl-2-hydroxyethyl bacteriochlorophyllide A dehydrogenase